MCKKILVVDDSIFIWEEMKQAIKGTEFEIVSFAKNGEEAITLYEELHPDVVTMDIILPGMDGIEASKEIIKKSPDAKIVVVSSLAYDETITESENAGACGFVFKPFEAEQMLKALRKVFEE